MDERDFIFNQEVNLKGTSTWTSPSNIALVKYWGKYDLQIPRNPSLSFTLLKSLTETKVSFSPRKIDKNEFSYNFLFNGKPQISFHNKIDEFFKKITKYNSYLKNHHLIIESNNSFPHSSGIASSASSMSSLSLCILEIEKKIANNKSKDYFLKKASFIARIGSGSASRSIGGPIMVWGKNSAFKKSSDLYAIEIKENVNKIFLTYQNSILLVDKSQKKISSSLGHDLMNNHPYAKVRFDQAGSNIQNLKEIISSGDLIKFIKIVELEALSLHALMMTSNPYFMLMKPNTILIINKIWEFRADTKCHICFTLDAGANLHLLYPQNEKELVIDFIENELKSFCQDGEYINDMVGFGSKKK